MSGAPPPIRLTAVGCGRVFERFHLPALSRVPELELVAVCEADPARLRWARARLPRIAHAPALDALSRNLAADAVLLLTPPTTHRALAERALSAGLHVLVEKPMTLDLPGARSMCEAAQCSGQRLQIGFNRRFRAPSRTLRDRVRAARDGAVQEISYELAVPSTAWGAKGDFLGTDAQGGGVLDDVLSHQVDLVRWISAAEPRRLRAQAHADGAVTCELELESGVKARCRAAHGAYMEYFEVVMSDGQVSAASGARTYGGRRRAGAADRRYARFTDRAALALNRVLGRRGLTLESFEAQLRDFAGAARGRGSEGAGPADGLAAVAAVEAARASLRDGGWREIG